MPYPLRRRPQTRTQRRPSKMTSSPPRMPSTRILRSFLDVFLMRGGIRHAPRAVPARFLASQRHYFRCRFSLFHLPPSPGDAHSLSKPMFACKREMKQGAAACMAAAERLFTLRADSRLRRIRQERCPASRCAQAANGDQSRDRPSRPACRNPRAQALRGDAP